MRNEHGFTLIEILVVVAITILLFGLLFTPMIAALNLTRQGRVKIEAQDAARLNLERVSRELSGAMFVYDNSAPIDVVPPGATAMTATVALPYGKIDLVMPRMMMHCDNPAHPSDQPRDYERDSDDPNWPGEEAWPSCPICKSTEVTARPVQPMMPSRRIVRYFIGLMDPQKPYSNNFEDKTAPSPENNTYVLYRAEFKAWSDPENPGNDLLPKRLDGSYQLNYADFFYDPQYSAAWKRISRIVGPARNANLVVFTESGTVATSSVRFTPTAVENDALSPTYLNDTDAETPTAIPTVFRAVNGHWTPDYKVFVYRRDYARNFSATYYTQPSGNDMWLWLYSGTPTAVFNIDEYRRSRNLAAAVPAGVADDQKLMLDVVENTGEVRFVFAASEPLLTTYDINGNGGYYQLPIQTNWGSNARIVPGSEEIMGPDQTPIRWRDQDPASPLPRTVRYQRIPLALGGRPGLNQYKIDYETGEIWFPSGLEKLPEDTVNSDNITVAISYKFHNNAQGDIVRADYTTKNLITVTFGVRLFDPVSRKMFATELSNKLRVRNTVR
ncbi:MAG: prepilin-type N-terminal cleavage/methylation domain-containing protein [Armatimonadota bacterium]|nr:prepilin-type N-terminal cleavage/methylation domain-containing protein [Armatimonadota bacterium]